MSARTLRITLIVLTVIGVGLASYLTYIHYAQRQAAVRARTAAAA